MRQKLKVLVRDGKKSLVASAVLSGGLFFFCTRPLPLGSDLMTRQGFFSGLMFVLLYCVFRALSSSVRRNLRKQQAVVAPDQVSRKALWAFVVYKEGVKTTVGVSLTLAWLAGLLCLSERLGQSYLLVPMAALTYTTLLFGLAYLFVLFVDLIPYPFGPHD